MERYFELLSTETVVSFLGFSGLFYLLFTTLAVFYGILALKTGQVNYKINYYSLSIMPFILAVIIIFKEFICYLLMVTDLQTGKILCGDGVELSLALDITPGFVGLGLSFVLLLAVPLCVLIMQIKIKMK